LRTAGEAILRQATGRSSVPSHRHYPGTATGYIHRSLPRHAAGEYLFHTGAPRTEIFVIAKGDVEIVVSLRKEEIVVAHLGAGTHTSTITRQHTII
jgi:CRP-like cAMP-binding protein